MSIRELIAGYRGTRLHLWEPLTPGAHVRLVWVEDRLFNEIQDPDQYRMGRLMSDLDHFSLGGTMTVGYGVEATCRIKQLDPRQDEIWELRSKDPEPQVRVFGRFADTDQFVATHACLRDHLGIPSQTKFEGNNWPAEIQRCKLLWNELFLGEPAHSGSNIYEYISANAMEVGKFA